MADPLAPMLVGEAAPRVEEALEAWPLKRPYRLRATPRGRSRVTRYVDTPSGTYVVSVYLASSLVERCLERCQEWGVRRVMLATKDAHGLYESYGFTPPGIGRFLELRLTQDRVGPTG